MVDENPYGPPSAFDGLLGTVSGSHTYAVPGDYLVTATDKDGGMGLDTLQVTVQNGFLRVCLYVDGKQGVRIHQDVTIECATSPDLSSWGGVASRARLDVKDRSLILGSLISLQENIELSKDAIL